MELLNQPFNGQLGDRLIELLDSEDFHTLNIAVAFAKNSGVLRIKDSLQRFRGRGGTVNAYVGVDLGGTSYEALTALLLHTDSLNVVHSERGQTFHVKIYQFIGPEKGLIAVGSNNLTGGGLWTNFESSLLVPMDSSSTIEKRIFERMGGYIADLTALKELLLPIASQDDIDKLLQHGYVVKEVAEQIRLAKIAARDGVRERLFGNGVRAKLPRVAVPKKDKTGAVSKTSPKSVSEEPRDEDQTIWFETKSMTGGSRNILDLSMRSLVERGDPKGTPFDLGDPRFMRGGVEFFELNPTATEQIKDITLNFEGVDYAGNTILFPTGNNANGTWRLQIKGTSSANRRITEAFRAKGDAYYLVKKIVTFTKVSGDYYFMSVFPESEIESFEAASRILARNGSTRSAKRLGLL